jgi:histidinol-phosphate/aromatic aminotransferase/cobyric acid decarboxylase-like protein
MQEIELAEKKTFKLQDKENLLLDKVRKLKEASGTHSPSISYLLQELKDTKLEVDACFLSNPYATDLFLEYFDKDVIFPKSYRSMLEYYPAQNRQIAEYISCYLSFPKEKIFIGNGAIEIIHAIANNFFGDTVVINTPTFSAYYEFCKTPPVFHKLEKKNDYQLNVKEYVEFCLVNKVDTAVIINPNNPDGGYVGRDDMEDIIKSLSHLKCIVIDESFVHFAKDGDGSRIPTLQSFVHEYSNVIIVKSMSKDFGVAGLRAGYALMSSEKVNLLLDKGYLWNSSGIAEYFFSLLAKPKFIESYEKIRRSFNEDIKQFGEELAKMKSYKIYPSQANYFLVELVSGIKSDEFSIALLSRYGIYIRSCSDKVGLQGEYIRVAVRSNRENKLILNALKELSGD